MNLSAATSSVADILNAVLTDFSEIQKSLEKNKMSKTATSVSPKALATIKRSPVIKSKTLMPGLERPLHYVHSLERHKAWYEQELVKQQQEEKINRYSNYTTKIKKSDEKENETTMVKSKVT